MMGSTSSCKHQREKKIQGKKYAAKGWRIDSFVTQREEGRSRVNQLRTH